MASESSSAMLDLNDADTEDTEAPSVTDDTREAVPLMMEHGYDIAVKVDAPMKQLSTLETFVTYRVRCVCARWPTPPAVRRRYNHFKLLHRRLCAAQAWLAPPALPPLHSARQQLDRYSPAFVAIRTMALHAFLDRVAKHPIFTHNEDFRIFLTTPDDEIDKVFKNENNAMNLWGLSSALYGANENKPTNGARVKDPEWSFYAEYLTSLQQKLTTLCTLTSKLHSGTAALSAEMLNMKRCCDAWASQARGDTARAAAAIGGCAAACTTSPRAAPSAAPSAAPRAAPARHRALLPLLAAYTAAHRDKIRQRDALHAAYVAGASTTGDMHNKLEQASEALRSELSDWLPKTRSEIKTLLLELADRQVNLYTQIFMSWEHALKLSNEANLSELFKTVSKTAVQNLSPSRCRSEMTPTETERDLDDLEIYSISDSEERLEIDVDSKNSSKDWVQVDNVQGHENCARGAETLVDDEKIDTDPFNIQDGAGLDPLNVQGGTGLDPLNVQGGTGLDPLNVQDVAGLDPLNVQGGTGLDPLNVQDGAGLDPLNVQDGAGLDPLNVQDGTGLYPLNVQGGTGLDPLNVQDGTGLDPLNVQGGTGLDPLNVQDGTGLDPLNVQDGTGLDPLNVQDGTGLDPLIVQDVAGLDSMNIQGDIDPLIVQDVAGLDSMNIHSDTNAQEKEDFLSEILDESVKNESLSLEQSLKSDVVSDPLREFSEVDLRNID